MEPVEHDTEVAESCCESRYDTREVSEIPPDSQSLPACCKRLLISPGSVDEDSKIIESIGQRDPAHFRPLPGEFSKQCDRLPGGREGLLTSAQISQNLAEIAECVGEHALTGLLCHELPSNVDSFLK